MRVLFALFLTCLVLPAQGERVKVYLDNGREVVGEVLKDTPENLILEIDLGTLLIPKERIRSKYVLLGAGKRPLEPHEGEAGAGNGGVFLPGGTAPARGGAPGFQLAASGERVLFHGRLLGRYAWTEKLDPPMTLCLLLGILFLFWWAIHLLGKILGMKDVTVWRSGGAALLWLVLILGLLHVPDPNLAVLVVAGFLVLVAWCLTTRKIFSGNWFQSLEMFFLSSLGILVFFILVEVAQNLTDL